MSKVFLLSYDISADDENYSDLIQKLEEFKAKRVLESVWSLKFSDKVNPEKIKNHFKNIAKNASIIVVEVADQAYHNIREENEEPYPLPI